ncbi:limonene-1,2-epoxide hydrolase family protein [Hyphococcus formosus]|uniref:nuclear transport factor 2 family protein n=1 Tax=Hyphococcus formosus TaxID=3143534 RepID=UPI00398ABB21
MAGVGLSNEEKLRLARTMADAWRDKDWRKVGDLFAEDGVLHSMMVAPVKGREEIYKRIAAMGAGIDQILLDIEHIGVIDGRVYIERVDRFVFNGHEGNLPVVGVISYNDDGLISEWREYYDRSELLKEMGVSGDFDHDTRQ